MVDILQKIDQIDRQIGELRRVVKEEKERVVPEIPRNSDAIPVMLTIDQAKEKTGLSYDFIRKLCLQGKIVYIRVGSKYLINQDALVRFLNDGEKPKCERKMVGKKL